MQDYQTKLYNSYDQRGELLDPSDNEKISWFKKHLLDNYLEFFSKNKNIKILDIGCNKGHLLAALDQLGYKNLSGMDLSPVDIKKAKKLLPKATIVCQDAQSFLKRSKDEYDVVTIKAVVEHIPKQDILPFFELINQSLSKKGVIIIDVPNMDWLFASHERYMDFTHEVGFTKESLKQIMNEVFTDVIIKPTDHLAGYPLPHRILSSISRRILNLLLKTADPEGGNNPLWSRSIIGIGRKK